MGRILAPLLLATAVALPLSAHATAEMTVARPRADDASSRSQQCRADGSLVRVKELPEGSGIAASRRHAGLLWAHNDSGDPEIFALNNSGAVVARVTLNGIDPDDWEAIASGPCPAKSCLFLGDIGDNNARRKRISVYRVPEPDAKNGAVNVSDAFHATYPDGPQDAETLLVTPTADIFIVTKGETGTIGLYRFPRNMQPGAAVQLERVGSPRKPAADERITDGSVSPSGGLVALRTNSTLQFYETAEFFSGKWREISRVPLTSLREPQGEGVTFADDATLYLVGEGGSAFAPGTFLRMNCGG